MRSRYYYSIVRGGISVIFNEGWIVFWFKLRKRLRRYTPEAILYRQWIAFNEPILKDLSRQKEESFSFPYRPKISFMATVSTSEVRLLPPTIESMIGQTYDNWQLYLYYVNSSDLTSDLVGSENIEKDGRIKVLRAAEDSTGPEELSTLLSFASGDFFGILDVRSELAPFALFEIVRLLNEQPDLDFIYSDEDTIDMHGRRSSPFFKPDWSPDMVLSWPYTGCFSIFSKKLVKSVSGLRFDFIGGNEYDLVLRVAENTAKIFHIPQVLYHRRKPPLFEKRQAANLGNDTDKKAISDYLIRNKIAGEVCDGMWPGSYRVKRKIAGSPLVSIIIPTKDNVKILKRCIDSISAMTEYKNYEIVVVDNQSAPSEDLRHYYHDLVKAGNVHLFEYNRPFNFAALNNYAVSQARGEYILFLNSDIEVISEEWLSAMLEHAQRKEVGAAGARLLFPDGSIQHCGVIIGLGSVAGHAYHRNNDGPGYFGRIDMINNYSAVTAACMLVRKEVFREVGGFDENLAIDYNDVDFCLKLRKKGYLIVYTPYARLYHLESYVRGYADRPEKRMRRMKETEYFMARWGSVIERGDPYYNPNLSLNRMDFAIEPHPRRKP